ncbi:endoribonuclease Dicer isoform X1 [Vespa velutina]|uniref:endoribonuclease Dicer isoform X1 n=1 Tax=Vespa velutina TaxID=202808 RepID=UPI001FB519DB|nr:endoribonuclease Dicer isoform X1 [Vespa velutina]
MENKSAEFIARPYQIDLYEKAMESNTIIYLPTGTGKTFIAMMVLKKLSVDIQKLYSQGGKRTIFVVNTVPLVTQQAEYIARHTGLSCKGYCGDMKVDFWTKEIWLKELDEQQVLVMTSQIFLDIINHAYLHLNKINLIIFDECHRAVNDHPMRQIMQRFEQCKITEQPKILALSATLLNSNVKLANIMELIKNLEITFHSKIATVNNVKGYCTNPEEIVIHYETYTYPESWHSVVTYLQNLIEFLNVTSIPTNRDYNESSKEFKTKTVNEELMNLIEDIKKQIDTTGLYGVNKCILLHLIQLEYKKRSIDDQNGIYIFEYMITELFKLRKLLEDEMKNYTDQQKIFEFSSDQVLQLFKLLKNFNDNKLDNQKFCCIIFVKRRSTAKILYHILKEIHTHDERYKFLLPDYTIGFNNNPYKNYKEVLCMSKWNREVLHRFRNGLSNCVIATDILDEGVDIPVCTLVIRFDLPTDFRSYIQSKGRARYSSSQYVIMLSKNDHNYIKKHMLFKNIDLSLQEILIGKSEYRIEPTAEEIKENLYSYIIEPYIVKINENTTSILTEQAAINLINRYCSLLLKSKFVSLYPTWKLHKIEENKTFQVSLKLPSLSPLKEVVFGDIMPSIDAAKKSAAFKTCVKLHLLGELSNNLLPSINDISDNTEYLFPNWINEDSQTNQPGTTRKKRYHKLKYPEALYGAFPSEGTVLHLHILSAEPVYSIPQDNRNLVFYNLLHDQAGYGILSTKSIPQIPSFPIYMNVGELNVNIKVDYATMILTNEQIEELKIFHTTIFTNIVSVIKPFMTFDNDNLDNSFLIVPTNNENEIDWNVVKKYKYISYIKSLAPLKNVDYELALIVPNYRSSPNVYVVTQVCDDLAPNSCFPTNDFLTYAHYYNQKHELKISDLNQSMLEVKPISMKINCIKPRNMKSGLSKRKRADALEDYDEHLVPELCCKVEFPALYWLKATTLPSILHRISQLLIALDLREIIFKEANLGTSLNDLLNHNWPPLVINIQESESKTEQMSEGTFDEIIQTGQPVLDLNGPEIDVLNTDANLYPWSKEQEPPDINRNAEQIQLIDIEYYCHFMSDTSNSEMLSKERKTKIINYKSKPKVSIPTLEILEANDETGPDPVLIMQALITSGNDVFDQERLEILGDSYLKFIISLYLYSVFPTYNEGRLTALKGKIIGNRNLYYCGIKKSIPGCMKVDDFIPMSTFIPPAYTTFRPLQKILLEAKVSPNVLYEIHIPEEERFSGYISENTKNEMQAKVLNWAAAESQTGIEYYIGVQMVPDKAVADCVEALISVYLKSMGMVGAVKLLMWFGILPLHTDINALLYSVTQKPEVSVGDPNFYMPWAETIEKNMNYKFRNRIYLLQAFSHPSYTENNITDDYQRLEFLGDAIIDFLITGYIHQYWELLSPGEITDLRSALVNNITFACLTVKYGLHTALLSYSPQLNDIIDRFVKFQEERNYVVDNENLWILLEEEECNMAEYVDVPKVLSDIFESFIGAVYLDTNKNIKQVWELLFALMYKEIDAFSRDVPKQPVRLIYETLGSNAKFLSATLIEGTNTIMVPLEITNKRKSKLFHGFGANKKQAKCAAAKQALKYLRCKNE